MTDSPHPEVQGLLRAANDYAMQAPSDLTAADITEGRVAPVFRCLRHGLRPSTRVTLPLVAVAASVALVIALVVATTSGPVAKTPKRPVSPAPTSTTVPQKKYKPSPSVTADTVLSVDITPDGQTWVSVRAHCRTGWCVDLARSVPDTERFTPLESTTVPAATGVADCNTADCGATEVVFANRYDGYLFDPGLYMTVDGGKSWRQVPGGTVNALALDGTRVLRGVFSHGGCPGPCDEQIQTSNLGSINWSSLPAAPAAELWAAATGAVLASSGTGTVYALGPTNLAQGYGPPSHFYRLSSGAQSWSSLPDPCPAKTDVEAMAASGSRLAVVCKGYSAAVQVAVSDDDGTTFAPAHPVPVPYGGLIALSPNELYVATGSLGGEGASAFEVARSANNGATWTRVLSGKDQLNSTLTYDTTLAADPQGPVYFVADPTILWLSPNGTTWTQVSASHL